MRTLFKNARVVTMNEAGEVLHGWLLARNGRIESLSNEASMPPPAADVVFDCEGRTLTPGFIQSHIHGCQTLFRGAADDLLLLDWLKTRIWPLEASHDAASLRASMQLTALELLRGGTTAMLTMETVRHTESAFDALSATPIRAVIGKCLMDRGEGVPSAMIESPRTALDAALELAKAFPNVAGARLRACLAPRFALSCSEGLMRDVAAAARQHGLLVHTHGAEQREEVALVEKETGKRNLQYLDHLGLANGSLRLAHVIHLDAEEEDLLVASRTHVLHCPSSNLKLGSGVAPIARYLERGVAVSLGADGAPCNNSLDGLREARLAALLQKPLFGPRALPARRALELLTIRGAAALGMEAEIGSLEPGKFADLVELDLEAPHLAPCGDVYSRIIYAAERSDVRRVFVAAERVIDQGQPTYDDSSRILANANSAAAALFSRAGITR